MCRILLFVFVVFCGGVGFADVVKFSQLPEASDFDGSEQFALTQDGVSRRAALDAILQSGRPIRAATAVIHGVTFEIIDPEDGDFMVYNEASGSFVNSVSDTSNWDTAYQKVSAEFAEHYIPVADSDGNFTNSTLTDTESGFGIGISSAEAPVHIFEGDAGGDLAPIVDTDLFVEDDGNCYIQLMSPCDRICSLYIGDASAPTRSAFEYRHGDDYLRIRSQSNNIMFLKANGIGIATETISAKLEVNGTVAATAFTTLSGSWAKRNIREIEESDISKAVSRVRDAKIHKFHLQPPKTPVLNDFEDVKREIVLKSERKVGDSIIPAVTELIVVESAQDQLDAALLRHASETSRDLYTQERLGFIADWSSDTPRQWIGKDQNNRIKGIDVSQQAVDNTLVLQHVLNEIDRLQLENENLRQRVSTLEAR